MTVEVLLGYDFLLCVESGVVMFPLYEQKVVSHCQSFFLKVVNRLRIFNQFLGSLLLLFFIQRCCVLSQRIMPVEELVG